MPDAVWLMMALACSVCGMGWLSLAMDVHWKQVRDAAPRAPHDARVLRVVGYGALLASLVLCLCADTATMAVLVWMMFLALGAMTNAFVLTWRPRLLAPLVAWRGNRGS